jgi:hypothetical protein
MIFVMVGAVLLGVAPTTTARVPQDVVDLRQAPAWRLEGRVGRIAPAGDVDGDGTEDVAVSRCGASGRRGRVWVVRGPFTDETARLETAGPGFTITGAEEGDSACVLSITPPGDVNGDGRDDLLVGADTASQNGRAGSGAVYVVFGKADDDPVDLADFDANTQGTAGYRVDGPSSPAFAGGDVAGLGDMNGDGRADFIVGAPFRGAAYVLFGQPTTTPVDLMTFDANAQGPLGFRIETFLPETDDLFSVGGAGDFNGDGIVDAIVGVVPEAHGSTGSAYVVFGKTDPLAVDTRARSDGVVRIKGAGRGDATGYSVAGAGDVNGDGLADVVVGAPKLYSCCRGKAAVVFGTPEAGVIALGDFEGAGFKVAASQERDLFGYSVVGAGDVDGDGLADVAAGAPAFAFPRRGFPGAVFVIYGKTSTGRVRAGRLNDDGLAIVGRSNHDWTGVHIGAPGDTNRDGVPDLIISATTGGRGYLLWLTRTA